MGGLFDTLIERSRDPMFDSVPGFAKKSFCAITAGGVAAAAGNPADLSLIRMQADSLLPAAQRRNYRNVVHAMTTIARTEGGGGLQGSFLDLNARNGLHLWHACVQCTGQGDVA